MTRRLPPVVLLAGTLAALPAAAETLPVGDEGELEVHGWGEAGFAALRSAAPDGDLELGTYLSMARLKGSLAYTEHLKTTLQVEAASGQLELLDAVAEVRPVQSVAVRIGQFKTPVSREFLEPAPELLFVHRGYTSEIAPRRRLGSELVLSPRVGEVVTRLQVGLFEGPGADGPFVDSGQLGVVRAGVELPVGLGLHAAAARALTVPEGGATEPYETVIDGAVTFDRDGWRLLGEGVVGLNDEERTTAGTFEIARRFGDAEEGVAWEPALGGDVRLDADALRSRGTAGLNLYFLGEHLVQTFDVVLEPEDEGASLGVFAQLQGGF